MLSEPHPCTCVLNPGLAPPDPQGHADELLLSFPYPHGIASLGKGWWRRCRRRTPHLVPSPGWHGGTVNLLGQTPKQILTGSPSHSPSLVTSAPLFQLKSAAPFPVHSTALQEDAQTFPPPRLHQMPSAFTEKCILGKPLQNVDSPASVGWM